MKALGTIGWTAWPNTMPTHSSAREMTRRVFIVRRSPQSAMQKGCDRKFTRPRGRNVYTFRPRLAFGVFPGRKRLALLNLTHGRRRQQGGRGRRYESYVCLWVGWPSTLVHLAEEAEEKEEETKGGKGKSGAPKKKFEVKKWNAVALWAWGTLLIGDALASSNLFSRHRCR